MVVVHEERDSLVCRDVLDLYGKLQPLEVPMSKWEHIIMDLITKLPRMTKGFDVIWVLVDRLTKSTHFLAIREISSAKKLADLYMR